MGALSEGGLTRLLHGIPALVTTRAAVVDSLQLRLLAHLAGVSPDAIERVRWTPSMAPPTHDKAGAVFVTLWSRGSTSPAVVTVDSAGALSIGTAD